MIALIAHDAKKPAMLELVGAARQAHPHEPDVQALMKVCDVHNIPLATNRATAILCLEALEGDAARIATVAGN